MLFPFLEKPVVEKPPIVGSHDRERDVTEDENSLYYIIRNSKSAIAVIFIIPFFFQILFTNCAHFIFRVSLMSGLKVTNKTETML